MIGTATNSSTRESDIVADNLTRVKVVGVGGGGSNAVNRMIEADIQGIEFIAFNTDAQALVRSLAPQRYRIGDRLTRGLGVGGDHKMGMLAADESREEIGKAVQGADLLFITAGMGGGTGTGAASVIAEVAKGLDILTIAVVTKPFAFEGVHRARVADEGITRLEERADTIIVIPNERLLTMCDENVSIEAAFRMVDDVLLHSVEGISEVITTSGHINLDFNDVKATMTEAGRAWIAMGYGSGEGRAVRAAQNAIVSPLFDFAIEKAKKILFNVLGNDLTLSEVNQAANVIKQVADPYAHIIFGLGQERKLGGDVKITLIATGFREGRHGARDAEDTEGAALIAEDGLFDSELPAVNEGSGRRSFFPWSRQSRAY